MQLTDTIPFSWISVCQAQMTPSKCLLSSQYTLEKSSSLVCIVGSTPLFCWAAVLLLWSLFYRIKLKLTVKSCQATCHTSVTPDQTVRAALTKLLETVPKKEMCEWCGVLKKKKKAVKAHRSFDLQKTANAMTQCNHMCAISHNH